MEQRTHRVAGGADRGAPSPARRIAAKEGRRAGGARTSEGAPGRRVSAARGRWRVLRRAHATPEARRRPPLLGPLARDAPLGGRAHSRDARRESCRCSPASTSASDRASTAPRGSGYVNLASYSRYGINTVARLGVGWLVALSQVCIVSRLAQQALAQPGASMGVSLRGRLRRACAACTRLGRWLVRSTDQIPVGPCTFQVPRAARCRAVAIWSSLRAISWRSSHLVNFRLNSSRNFNRICRRSSRLSCRRRRRAGCSQSHRFHLSF